MKEITHKDLCLKAVNWLLQAKQCNPVFAERGSQSIREIPDAIGFTSKGCVVVEVKVSKSDFLADIKKPHRDTEESLGSERYYVMPEELYSQCKDHDFRGWGVAVWRPRYHRVEQVRGMVSGQFSSNIQAERDFLRSRILEVQRFGR